MRGGFAGDPVWLNKTLLLVSKEYQFIGASRSVPQYRSQEVA